MTTKPIRISVIMPCLNEELTVASCVRDARSALLRLRRKGIFGEVVVVDNGSTDGSVSAAKKAGARIINEKKQGYGSAYLAGIRKTKGTIIVIGDSDGTYDFRRIDRLVKPLVNGADIVLGSRFTGTMAPNAMQFTHRYIGNPLLTGMLNGFYGSRITDAQTGMRAILRNALNKLDLQSPGMVFASEMIMKSIFLGLKMQEVPISYRPRIGVSKLSPLADAWRHVRYMLLYAPTYTLLVPGALLFFFGAILSTTLLISPIRIGAITMDIHSMTVTILLTSLGVHIILSGLFARRYVEKKLGLHGGILGKILLRHLTSERLLSAGAVVSLSGSVMICLIALHWGLSGFGPFNRIRETVYYAGLTIVGAQILFTSFLYGLLEEK